MHTIQNKTFKSGKSSKEVILNYLRLNRGREIPLSEIKMKCGLKSSTISNAIKELSLQDLVEIERRPFKRGQYTVITLRNDIIEKRYIHPKEHKPPAEDEISEPDKIVEKPILDSLDPYITHLKSNDYNMMKFSEEITNKYPESFDLVVSFITPLLVEVGRRWEEGSLTTAEEHVISSRLEKLMIDLIPKNMNGAKGTIILVPVEGEEHIIGLVTLELLLVEKNYRVINLGRQLPLKTLIQYIDDPKIKPEWIFFSITLEIYTGTLIREIREIKEHFNDRLKIAVGGQGVKEHQSLYMNTDTIITSIDQLSRFFNNIL